MLSADYPAGRDLFEAVRRANAVSVKRQRWTVRHFLDDLPRHSALSSTRRRNRWPAPTLAWRHLTTVEATSGRPNVQASAGVGNIDSGLIGNRAQAVDRLQ